MSPGGFLSLLAATVISVAGAGLVVATQPDFAVTNLSGGGPMFPALAQSPADVRRITLERPGYTIELDWSEGVWVAGGMGDYPVLPELATNLVTSLAAMTSIEPKTDDPDWFRYIRVGGPDAPPDARGTRVAAYGAGDVVLADAILGKSSTSIGYAALGGIFVRPLEGAQSWLVEGTAQIPTALADWFAPLFSIPGPDIARVAFLTGSEVVLDANKADSQSSEYQLTALSPDVGPPGSTANSDALRSFTQAVVSVTLENVRRRESVTIAPDARTIRIVTRAELQLDATLGEADGQTWVAFDVSAPPGSAGEADAAAIASRVGGMAFQVSERRIDLMAAPLAGFITLPGAAQ